VFAKDSTHPVVCITWGDVKDYIDWLNKKTGFTYRLLSETEWEYIARAGSTTTYSWGDTADHNFANYGADSGYAGAVSGKDKWMYTSPVGSFAANAFGVHDIIGNVNQYLQDCFSIYSAGSPTDGYAEKKDVLLKMTGDLSSMNNTNSCTYRLVRGGNYGDPPTVLRSAYRSWTLGPNYSSAALGFRLARSL
jgi:formylglycine-generating enzyme required for sulfatase activity